MRRIILQLISEWQHEIRQETLFVADTKTSLSHFNPPLLIEFSMQLSHLIATAPLSEDALFVAQGIQHKIAHTFISLMPDQPIDSSGTTILASPAFYYLLRLFSILCDALPQTRQAIVRSTGAPIPMMDACGKYMQKIRLWLTLLANKKSDALIAREVARCIGEICLFLRIISFQLPSTLWYAK